MYLRPSAVAQEAPPQLILKENWWVDYKTRPCMVPNCARGRYCMDAHPGERVRCFFALTAKLLTLTHSAGTRTVRRAAWRTSRHRRKTNWSSTTTPRCTTASSAPRCASPTHRAATTASATVHTRWRSSSDAFTTRSSRCCRSRSATTPSSWCCAGRPFRARGCTGRTSGRAAPTTTASTTRTWPL